MKQFLLEFLVCPSCLPEEHSLQEKIESRSGDDILSGSLMCPNCGKAFPVRDGIAFLHPDPGWKPLPGNKYETEKVLSSYMWSHFGNLMDEEDHIDAYKVWADVIEPVDGLAVDIGGAVGRFALEMSAKSDFVVGLDLSLLFVSTARRLARDGEIEVKLFEEGYICRKCKISVPSTWRPEKTEFIVADALYLPFRSRCMSLVSSLNVIDKVPDPMRHLTEMNRVARTNGAQLLLSDPFSWSEESAPLDVWLGGKENGAFSGYGLDNIAKILQSGENLIIPPWRVVQRSHVWWKLRTHRNHFELIRSLFLKSVR